MSRGNKKRPSPGRGSGEKTSAQSNDAARPHAEPIAAMAAAATPPPLFLGHPKAVDIVCACANTSADNLGRSLDQLGLNGVSFRKCVFDRVEAAGYGIDIDAIPNSPATKLSDVVNVIQNAKRKP